jgi:hypothetical protein
MDVFIWMRYVSMGGYNVQQLSNGMAISRFDKKVGNYQ